MREINIRKKKINATKKNYLLQQQNKATATNKKQSEMQESNIIIRLTQQRKKYLLQQQNKATATTRNKAQCEMQHLKKLM